MIISKTLNRHFARAILICFTPFAVAVPTSQAAIIDTDVIISGSHAQSNRAHLIGSLNRTELRDQMLSAGINPDQLQERIAHLSDKEVAVLNEQLDSLPAGGSLIGYSVFIFLVLLMTDIMGYTEIFPFVKKTVK
jgi:hypothetical protein